VHINFYAIVNQWHCKIYRVFFCIISLSIAVVAGCPGRCRLSI
jgi:hypothetical protein